MKLELDVPMPEKETGESLMILRETMKETLRNYSDTFVFQLSEAAAALHRENVTDKNTKRLREKSGNVSDSRLLVAFLYVLMRDVVTPGTIEGTLLKLSNENVENPKDSYLLTNGYLAQYAQDIADRLTADRLTGDNELSPMENKFKR